MTSRWYRFVVVGLLLSSTAGLAVAEDAKEEAIKEDRKQIEGTWRAISIQNDGEQLSDADAKQFMVVNGADGTWSLHLDGKELNKGNSTFDPTKSPKWIDFTVEIPGEKPETRLGIYELGEKTRTLCFADEGKERPTKFASEPGSGHTLIIFQRD